VGGVRYEKFFHDPKARSEIDRNEMLEAISQTLRETIQDSHRLVFDLILPLLNETGLGVALSECLKEQIE
jgi:signal transduction histidine kinase